MKEKQSEKFKKFKGGRFRAGDEAIRVMEEGESTWRDKCTVFKVTRRFIICDILMAEAFSERNTLQQIVFNKKTGFNIRGEDFGRIEKSDKKKLTIHDAELVELFQEISSLN